MGHPSPYHGGQKDSLMDSMEQLRLIAEQADQEGHRLYASRAKVLLTKALGDFPNNGGYPRFIDFLREGQARGFFTVFFDGQHPYITTRDTPPEKTLRDQSKFLKPEVWNAVVDWDSPPTFWDSALQVFVEEPVTSGAPEREEEAVTMPPLPRVTKEMQLDWMRDFASSIAAPLSEELNRVLSDGTPGAFKALLRRHHLQQQWGSYLRGRVIDHVQAWASEHSVPIEALTDDQMPKSAAKRPAGRVTSSVPTPAHSVLTLRRRLHQIIDQMSLAELAALQIPATYLLD